MADMGQAISAVQAYGDAREAETVAVLQPTLDGLEAEVARLQAELDALTGQPLLIGADVNVPNGNTLANFQAADKLIGPLRVRRSFPKVDTIAGLVAADKAAGIVSFVSTKPSPADAQLTAMAESLPAGTYYTEWHEPENDAPGAQFVARFKHMYEVMKAANPDLQIGPVHLTYAWRNGVVGASGANTGTQPQTEWVVPDSHKDFTGYDTYNAKGGPLATDPQFQACYGQMLDTSEKPHLLVEYGQVVKPPGGTLTADDLARRAALIREDAEWIKTQGRIKMWLYWNGTGRQGDWSLQDPASQAAWRDVAAAGRTA